jgi:hypothetical protein
MQKLILICLAAIMLLFSSCGGGGGPTLPPGSRDLAGLEGVWTINLAYSGNIKTPEGTIPVAYSGTGSWTITKNTIITSGGNPLVWSYNGSVLTIQNNQSVSDWDIDCGDVLSTVQGQLSISITPGSTYGNLSGTCNITIVTGYCGNGKGKVVYSGHLARN